MKRCSMLLAACLFTATFLLAQKPAPINSGEVMEKALKLHNEEKYKEAIQLYKQVPRNDTNYTYSLYETAFSQSADNDLDGAIKTCRLGLQQRNDSYEADFRLLLASCVDDKGMSEEALKIYDSALLKYPNLQGLLLNKGLTMMRLKRISEAEAIFKDLLLRNPFYASAHYRLGQCALQKGELIQAVMCFYTYLLNNPGGTQSGSIIKILDNLSKGTDDVMEVVNKRQAGPSGNLALVEQIVLSKIALDKGYKILTDLDDPIIRQLQVIMEKLEYDKDDPDFYMQYYVPLLKDLFNKGLFEPAIFEAFSNLKLETIQRYLKKNPKEIDKAVSVVSEYQIMIRSTREPDYTKRLTTDPIYQYDNGILYGKGKMKGDVLTGRAEFYYKNGNIKSFGDFTDNGKKQGKWTYYYDNGQPSGFDYWEKGEQTGEDLTYNKHGVLITKAYYKNGKLNGEKTSYFSPGHVLSSIVYKDDKEEGKYLTFYTNGRRKIEAITSNGEFNGAYKGYYENGKIKIVTSYLNEKQEGSYKSYYENGQLEFEGMYKNDLLEGEAKTYHPNSKLMRTATYVKGEIEGDEIEYSDESILLQKVPHKKSKVEGLASYYDSEGKLYCTFLYDNNKLKVAKYFDKSGKEISTSVRQNKLISLVNYNEQRFKSFTAVYNDDAEKQGDEIFYYNSGQIKESNTYVKGILEGVSTGYYPNGKKQYEANYAEGKKNGYTRNYFLNGQLSSEGWYSDDELNGDWVEYNEKGNITSITTYLNNDIYGIKQGFLANGKLDDEEVYENGWLTAIYQYDTLGNRIHTMELKNGSGPYTGIYYNGKKKYEGVYKNGKPDGLFTINHFDGSVQIKKTYDMGLLTGSYTEYYYGGQLSVEGNYELGDKKGTWKSYSLDGKLSREERYTDGKLSGLTTYYFPDGKPEREIMYKDGLRNGLYKRYAADGSLVIAMQYKDDVAYAFTYQDKNKQLLPYQPIGGDKAKVKSYFSNGTVSAEMEYLDGELVGSYRIYYPDGKVYYEEENLENGLTHGRLAEYYPAGKKKYGYTYYYNNLEGPYKDFFEDGTVKEEGTGYNGSLNGSQKIYNASGKLIETRIYYFGTLLNVIK
jgi:antitoxin component YwqK of YwqJK toxin-antitoxin module